MFYTLIIHCWQLLINTLQIIHWLFVLINLFVIFIQSMKLQENIVMKENEFVVKKVFLYGVWKWVCIFYWPDLFIFRLLSQFSFKLSRDWEIPHQTKTSYQPLKEGVKDMLVKHHLFSWDLWSNNMGFNKLAERRSVSSFGCSDTCVSFESSNISWLGIDDMLCKSSQISEEFG
jgi:hypothetical protein